MERICLAPLSLLSAQLIAKTSVDIVQDKAANSAVVDRVDINCPAVDGLTKKKQSSILRVIAGAHKLITTTLFFANYVSCSGIL